MRLLFFIFFLLHQNLISQSSFGPPSSPTYTNVESSIPQGYYSQAEGKSGADLKESIHQIIANHIVYPYTSSNTDTWDILQLSDQDPLNNENMILVYTERSQDKLYRDGGGNYSSFENGNGTQNNSWNREHIWPKSHGFPDQDDIAYTDVHNLKPADRSVNSSRGTKDYDYGGQQHAEASNCLYDSDSWEAPNSVKGDIARIIFYMVVRYDPGYDHINNIFDLELVDYTTPANTDPIFGKLSSLIQWHFSDPVDDYEKNRNEVIFGFQGNRNPFIDHPSLVSFIWGENIDQQWSQSLNIFSSANSNFTIYPNPSDGTFQFNKQLNSGKVSIYSMKGNLLISDAHILNNSLQLDLPPSPYILKLDSDQGVFIKKIIIQ
jgi:endonuclease I